MKTFCLSLSKLLTSAIVKRMFDDELESKRSINTKSTTHYMSNFQTEPSALIGATASNELKGQQLRRGFYKRINIISEHRSVSLILDWLE